MALLLDQVRAFRGIYIADTLLPFVVTPVVGTLVFRQTFDRYGIYPYILEQLFGLDINFFTIGNITWLVFFHAIWYVTPFAIITLFAGLQTVPQEPLEAAKVDGTSWLMRLRHVVLPHLRSLFLFIALLLALLVIGGALWLRRSANDDENAVAAPSQRGWLLPGLIQFAEFYDYFLNSVIVTVGTVLISISIGCLAGYGLARYSGIAGVVILFVALAFRALPRMAFILPYYYFAQISGLYGTFPLLIITFVAINQPFTIWMLRSFFMEIPRELEEAAMIDGCNRLTSFVRVIVPIVWPGIITTALFTLLLAYNEFLLARLLTATNSTLPVGISRYTSGEDARLIPLSNASPVSISLPIVFIIIFFQRYLIKGLAGSAVKG